jgi:hypothetical protein
VYRIDCHDRIKQVKASYITALQTVNVLRRLVELQPDLRYDYELDLSEMRNLERELHDAYFVRMFARFESSIRHFWRTTVRDTKPPTEQLINSVADRRGIEEDVKDTLHEIRDFRNFLIHEDHDIKRRFTIEEASKTLNKYLARLPLQW